MNASAAPADCSVTARPKVLAIDDDTLVLRIVRRVLEPACEVVTESRAGEALARIERGESFDLIVCDVQMPGVSGVDFHRALMWRRPQLASRTVFTTGGVFTPEAADYLEALPSLRTVNKPFDLDSLRSLLGGLGRAP